MIARLMARVGLVTPEQRAWAWYDWANSAFFTTVVTAVFPGFFSSYAAAPMVPAEATARFALITTLSVATIAISAPLLGAMADHSAAKKRLLLLFMGIGALACGSMAFIGEGNIALASALFFIANVGASGSTVFYDSLLPHVAKPEESDRVSAAGYAMGYIGGGTLLLVNLAWILKPDIFGFPSTPAAIKASFVSVAVWWAVFSLPIFRVVREPITHSRPAGESSVALVAALTRLAGTFRAIRKYRNAFLLFIAMLLYQDGIQTIIRMAGVYGAEVGVDQTAQIAAFVMVQFLGIPFSLLFGSLGARIGSKRAIFIAISVYALATVLAYFMKTATHFFILAAMIATVQGGAQALSRAFFSRMVPADRTSEFFGFFAVSERFATVLGPFVFYLSVTITGTSHAAIIAILGFFVAGAWVLSLVDEEEGIRAAQGV
jgi:UMF1 family MFS transporter